MPVSGTSLVVVVMAPVGVGRQVVSGSFQDTYPGFQVCHPIAHNVALHLCQSSVDVANVRSLMVDWSGRVWVRGQKKFHPRIGFLGVSEFA